jgi:hypothetical protein
MLHPILVTPLTPRQNAPATGFIFISLPQSKRALREPLPMQLLAGIPAPGGGAPHFPA